MNNTNLKNLNPSTFLKIGVDHLSMVIKPMMQIILGLYYNYFNYYDKYITSAKIKVPIFIN